MPFGLRLCHALALVIVLAGGPITDGRAADPVASAHDAPQPASPAPSAAKLPADAVTRHSLTLPDRTLAFTATAGAIRTTDERGRPVADIAFIAYTLDGADRGTRSVTFVFNGGPGMASGWLQVGAIGPWVIAARGETPRPSMSSALVANPDTWLDFTDLVFIDPAGTGYSRALVSGDDARRALFSVAGDIDNLAQAVRRWLDQSGRIVSPKFILGESYGGFRAPLLARALQSDQGVGVSGLIMLSPALDFGGRSAALDPLAWAIRLPSMAAAARSANGPVTRAQLQDAEQYAAGDYITDLLRGVRDPEAVTRLTEHVAALTGLDPALVRRYDGRIDMDVFLHDRTRDRQLVGSPYDATITSPDPFPLDPYSDYQEPVVHALLAPITSGMVALYGDALNWRPDSPYQLSNETVFRSWDWGRRMYGGPQSVSALRTALALDPAMRVLIAHGVFDLVTPYFGTALILRQIPNLGTPGRIRLVVYPGGHMFYTQASPRSEFRAEARKLITEP